MLDPLDDSPITEANISEYISPDKVINHIQLTIDEESVVDQGKLPK